MTNPYRAPAEQSEEVFCANCRWYEAYSYYFCNHPDRPVVKSALDVQQPSWLCSEQNKNNDCERFWKLIPASTRAKSIPLQLIVTICIIATSIIGFLWLLYFNL